MEAKAFLERVLQRLPTARPGAFTFQHWNQGGRPTDEGVGLLPVPGVHAAKAIDAVMDVDHYVGNVKFVATCRSLADARFVKPAAVRFYQKIEVPILGVLHHELALHRLGEHKGYLCAGWELLVPETDRLSSKDGIRSDYNHGLWLAGDGVVGYALGSAPKRDDVGFLKWKALTAGADAGASRVVKENIEGMARWASTRRAG